MWIPARPRVRALQWTHKCVEGATEASIRHRPFIIAQSLKQPRNVHVCSLQKEIQLTKVMCLRALYMAVCEYACTVLPCFQPRTCLTRSAVSSHIVYSRMPYCIPYCDGIVLEEKHCLSSYTHFCDTHLGPCMSLTS